MAHIAKFAQADAGNMFRHYERAKTKEGEYIRFRNQDIDTSKSHLNYNLSEQKKNQHKFLAERLEQLKYRKQKNNVVMCDAVVTCPDKIIGTEWEKPFFIETAKFLSSMFGVKNEISSHVHRDETTPHIHYSFVPVYEKDGIEKLTIREILNRRTLKDLHPKLDKHLRANVSGYAALREFEGIITGKTKEIGNLSISDLKKGGDKLREENTALARTNRKLKAETKAVKQMYENTVVEFIEHQRRGSYGRSAEKTATVGDELRALQQEKQQLKVSINNENKELISLREEKKQVIITLEPQIKRLETQKDVLILENQGLESANKNLRQEKEGLKIDIESVRLNLVALQRQIDIAEEEKKEKEKRAEEAERIINLAENLKYEKPYLTIIDDLELSEKNLPFVGKTLVNTVEYEMLKQLAKSSEANIQKSNASIEQRNAVMEENKELKNQALELKRQVDSNWNTKRRQDDMYYEMMVERDRAIKDKMSMVKIIESKPDLCRAYNAQVEKYELELSRSGPSFG